MSMANKQHEILSVVMDDEATEAELQQFLSCESEVEDAMKDKWADYHLVGDIMRSDVGDSIDFCLADKIEAALENEVTHVAEPVEQKQSNVVHVSFGEKVRALADTVLESSVARYASQFAVAATVAAVSVIGVQQYSQTNNGLESDNSPLPVLQVNPVTMGSASPVSLSTNHINPQRQRTQMSEQQLRLNALLLDHQRQVRLKPDNLDDEKDNKESH